MEGWEQQQAGNCAIPGPERQEPDKSSAVLSTRRGGGRGPFCLAVAISLVPLVCPPRAAEGVLATASVQLFPMACPALFIDPVYPLAEARGFPDLLILLLQETSRQRG